MRARRVLLVGLALLAAGCQSAAGSATSSRAPGSINSAQAAHPPAPTGQALPAPVERSLQAALRTAASSGIPGIEAAVVTDHGTWQGAAGVDGRGASVEPQALMAVGSVSKTFTAAEVLHLVAAGRVDLDAPMSRYVHSPLVANGATVRQTLGMLGGLTDGHYMRRVNEGSARTPDARVTLDQALAADTEKPGAAGKAQSYSNVSFLLLARLIEAVTHRSYASAVHADLLAPAALMRVAVQDADKPVPPLAYPVDPSHHKPITDGYLPDRYTASAALGAGSIAATARDEALWGYDLYTGRVLPAPLTALMMTPQRPGGLSYGLGTVVSDPSRLGLDAPAVGHDGLVVHHRADGINDGYRSVLLVVPSKHVSVAVTIDDAIDSPVGIALALLRAFTP